MKLKVNLEKCLGNFTHNFRKVLLKKGCFEKFVMITLDLEIGKRNKKNLECKYKSKE